MFQPTFPPSRHETWFSPRYEIITEAPGLAAEAARYLQAPPHVFRDEVAWGAPDLTLLLSWCSGFQTTPSPPLPISISRSCLCCGPRSRSRPRLRPRPRPCPRLRCCPRLRSQSRSRSCPRFGLLIPPRSTCMCVLTKLHITTVSGPAIPVLSYASRISPPMKRFVIILVCACI